VFINVSNTHRYNIVYVVTTLYTHAYNLYTGGKRSNDAQRATIRVFISIFVYLFFSNFIHIIVTFTSQSEQYKYI